MAGSSFFWPLPLPSLPSSHAAPGQYWYRFILLVWFSLFYFLVLPIPLRRNLPFALTENSLGHTYKSLIFSQLYGRGNAFVCPSDCLCVCVCSFIACGRVAIAQFSCGKFIADFLCLFTVLDEHPSVLRKQKCTTKNVINYDRLKLESNIKSKSKSYWFAFIFIGNHCEKDSYA